MLVIDYFDRGKAVLTDNEEQIIVKRKILPPGAKEGDVIQRMLCIDQVPVENASVMQIVRESSLKNYHAIVNGRTLSIDKRLLNVIQPFEFPCFVYLYIDKNETENRRKEVAETMKKFNIVKI